MEEKIEFTGFTDAEIPRLEEFKRNKKWLIKYVNRVKVNSKK